METELLFEIKKILLKLFPELIDLKTRKLTGGSSRETLLLILKLSNNRSKRLILRLDPPFIPARGADFEARIMSAVKNNHVPVPNVLAYGKLGKNKQGFVLSDFIYGETQPKKILYETKYEPLRKTFVAQLAKILSCIHSTDISKLPKLPEHNELDAIENLYNMLGQKRPVFDLAFQYLKERKPRSLRKMFIHGDFRLGNFLVGSNKIKAILDWELCQLGDPRVDLGWLCAKPWRFGALLPVAGMGSYEELLDRYNRLVKTDITFEELKYFETLSNLRWGVYSLYQVNLHESKKNSSMDLAAIGRRIAETEWDLLTDAFGVKIQKPISLKITDYPNDLWLQNPPGNLEMLDLIKEFLISLLPSMTGYQRYNTKIAVKFTEILKRESAFGKTLLHLAAIELKKFNVNSFEELSQKITSNQLRYDNNQLINSLTKITYLKLKINNPDYLANSMGASQEIPSTQDHL